jgi:opacity protein-like surface antigen
MKAIVSAAASLVLLASAAAQAQNSQIVTRAGSQPATKGPAQYFTGNVRVDPLFTANESAAYSGGQVTFEPGARSNWHTHPAGQRLIGRSHLVSARRQALARSLADDGNDAYRAQRFARRQETWIGWKK